VYAVYDTPFQNVLVLVSLVSPINYAYALDSYERSSTDRQRLVGAVKSSVVNGVVSSVKGVIAIMKLSVVGFT